MPRKDAHVTPWNTVLGVGAGLDEVSFTRQDAAVVFDGDVAGLWSVMNNSTNGTCTSRRFITVQTAILGEPCRRAALHFFRDTPRGASPNHNLPKTLCEASLDQSLGRCLQHGQLAGSLFNLPATSVSSTFLRALRNLMCGAEFWSVPGLRAASHSSISSTHGNMDEPCARHPRVM